MHTFAVFFTIEPLARVRGARLHGHRAPPAAFALAKFAFVARDPVFVHLHAVFPLLLLFFVERADVHGFGSEAVRPFDHLVVVERALKHVPVLVELGPLPVSLAFLVALAYVLFLPPRQHAVHFKAEDQERDARHHVL